MYRRKYPKTNLRNPKNINPNPKDSDQKERKTQAVATEADPGRSDPGARAPGLGHARPGANQAWVVREPQAWVVRGLGLVWLGATQAREPQA